MSEIREETIDRQMYGESFAELWPQDLRPVRLSFKPGVRVEACILSTPDGPDRATFLNADGEPCQEVGMHIFEPPHYILLE